MPSAHFSTSPFAVTPESIAELAYWHLDLADEPLGDSPSAWRHFWARLIELGTAVVDPQEMMGFEARP